MTNNLFLAALVSLLAISAAAEQYKLKLPVTVDIIEDGEVVGTKKLKAGTVLQLADEAAADEKPQAKAGKMTPSKISPMMFKNTHPASAVFNAEVELGDSYYGPFEGKEKTYWNFYINTFNADWSDSERLDGYVKKTAPIAKTLLAIVKDGKAHPCHVKVSPVKAESYNDLVTIEAIEEAVRPD